MAVFSIGLVEVMGNDGVVDSVIWVQRCVETTGNRDTNCEGTKGETSFPWLRRTILGELRLPPSGGRRKGGRPTFRITRFTVMISPSHVRHPSFCTVEIGNR